MLHDDTVVAVQRVHTRRRRSSGWPSTRCRSSPKISHRNIARVVGFCLLDLIPRAVLLVQESCAGGTLEDHLRRTATGGQPSPGTTASTSPIELASALAYLQGDDAFLHDLRSSNVFLDADLTAKNTGHKLVSSTAASYHYNYYYSSSPAAREQDVVCNFGLLLIELLTGLLHQDPFEPGRLHEVINPTLLASPSSSGRNQQAAVVANGRGGED